MSISVLRCIIRQNWQSAEEVQVEFAHRVFMLARMPQCQMRVHLKEQGNFIGFSASPESSIASIIVKT
jgi:hypothetical protein